MTIRDCVQVGCESFILVTVGGSVFFFLKGALLSPFKKKGCLFCGGVEEVINNWPRVRRWAAWFGVLQAIDSSMDHLPDIYAPLSLAVAWGGANALFSANRGTRAAVFEGLKGAGYSVLLVCTACTAFGLKVLLQSRESSSQ